MTFRIASSPYTHNKQRTDTIMLWVVIACIPGILAQTYFFGYGTLIQLVISSITALIAEACVLKLRKQPVSPRLKDNSALLTGILLAISIPPYAPWWIIVIGSLSAIILAKQLYGGLGQNPFNPAMVGYVILLISFPVPMTSWSLPLPLHSQPLSIYEALQFIIKSMPSTESTAMIDGITQATPLDTFKTGLNHHLTTSEILKNPVYNAFAGIGWLWVNIAFLTGGIILLIKKCIGWQIPVSFLLILTLLTLINQVVSPETAVPLSLQLFSGATMLGAFFIATDPVTASTTVKGKLIFGSLVGFLVWLIRTHGSFPDAVAFSILLANMTVPLIDHYTQPRPYGHKG